MTIRIPQNKQYTIRFNSVDNYTTPKSQTYTATAGGFNPQTYTYSTCKVTINITGYAATVTLTHPDTLRIYSDLANGDVVYMPTSSLPLKVSAFSPEGYSCTVTGDDISGDNLTVAINYVQVTTGIFVIDKDGYITSPENWNTSNNGNAAGIYICAYGDDENGNVGMGQIRQVILSKDQLPATDWCVESISDDLNPDISNISPYDGGHSYRLMTDFNGTENSRRMYTGEYPCQDACMDYTISATNLTQIQGISLAWRLPSAGEMHLVTDNMREVNSLLGTIGGTKFGVDSIGGIMTNTQAGAGCYWTMFGAYGTGGHMTGVDRLKYNDDMMNEIKIRPFLHASDITGVKG